MSDEQKNQNEGLRVGSMISVHGSEYEICKLTIEQGNLGTKVSIEAYDPVSMMQHRMHTDNQRKLVENWAQFGEKLKDEGWKE